MKLRNLAPLVIAMLGIGMIVYSCHFFFSDYGHILLNNYAKFVGICGLFGGLLTLVGASNIYQIMNL